MSDPQTTLTVQCPNCSTHNSVGKEFCSECGSSLWLDCPACGERVSVSEKFCGKCGSNIKAWFEDESKKVDDRLEQVKALQRRGDFGEAMRVCRSLLSMDAERYADAIASAKQCLVDLQSLHDRAETRVEQDFESAKRLIEKQEYEEALQLLSKIPGPFKTDEVETLIQSCQGQCDEIKRLKTTLPARLKSQPMDAFEDLAKLVKLNPKDLKFRKLGQQLRDQVFKKAYALYEAQKFTEAARLIRRVPEEFEREETKQLKDLCAEAAWIKKYLKESPYVDDNLVACTAKYAQLASKSRQAQEWKIQARLRWEDSVKSGSISTWVSKEGDAVIGSKVKFFNPLKGFTLGNVKFPGGIFGHQKFSVALGLAVQAIDAGVISELFSGEKKSLISKLGFKAKPPVEAWGIDLGISSIKAVKLARQGEDFSIQDVRVLELEKSAPQTRTAAEERELLRGALVKLRDDADLKGTPCLFSISSNQTLARFMQFPSVEDKKFVAMVEAEARHSIPFPLDDVEWFWARFATLESGRVPVAVLTARKDEVQQRMQMLKLLDFNVIGLQCDAVALFQLLRFQQEQTLESDEDRPRILVDMGAESMQMVLVNQDRFWFRATSHGGSHMSLAIGRELKLPYADAEQVKVQPFGSSELLALAQAVEKPIGNAVREIERSCTAASKEGFVTEGAELHITGGAARSIGFMHALTTPAESMFED